MAVRPILRWPDPRLTTPAARVAEVDAAVRAHWADMIDTMEAMPGVGLAAPQIAVMLRLAVVDASDRRGQAIVMANPAIIHASTDLLRHPEGSPCLPGVSAAVARPRAVTVRYLGADGAQAERVFEGLWAVSVQHQIDHLDGRMYFDRLSRLKRDMLLRRARKAGAG